VGIKYYHSLVPGSLHPIYFNPAVDYVHCGLSGDAILDISPYGAYRRIVPFIDPNIDVSLIRFLLMHHEYWMYRRTARPTCPITELRNFHNLEITFILPSIEQNESSTPTNDRESFWVWHPLLADALYPYEDYMRKPAADNLAPEIGVPGFQICEGRNPHGASKIERQFLLCFGFIDIDAVFALGISGPINRPWQLDGYWTGRPLPCVRHLHRHVN
jgi:hypothetical protein